MGGHTSSTFSCSFLRYGFLGLKIIFQNKIEVEINKKQKAFKKFMSPQLSLRYTPDIRFILDETLAYSEKIDNLLKKTE